MLELVPLEPVDYLVIGHVTQDLTPAGTRPGGTATFAALTARSLGLRAGVLTSAGSGPAPDALAGIPVILIPSEHSTTFENQDTATGRRQVLHARAAQIPYTEVPAAWRNPAILHLGPVAGELESTLPEGFAPALLGITPQGWLRAWDAQGRVSPREWQDAGHLLGQAGAVVLSREDLGGDDEQIEWMAQQTPVLAVTEGPAGSVLYWHGDRRRFRAPEVQAIDTTGAGDIFAAAFFIRLQATRDPWEAARFATQLAARSVTRAGLEAIPTPAEIAECLVEVFLVAHIYTLVNQKGGVGKTTTAINLGAYLAKFGQRVLVVDLDPQANATSCLGVDKLQIKGGTYEALLGRPAAPFILMNDKLKLALLPSSPSLAGAEVELVEEVRRESRLKQAIEPLDERYDYILVDCPPSLGLLTVNGLLAARDGVLVPVQCEYLALEGLGQLTLTIQRIRSSLFPDLKVRGVILTMFDPRTNLSTDVVSEVNRHFPDQVFKSIVPRSIRLAEAPSYGLPISSYAPGSVGAQAYEALARELLKGDGARAYLAAIKE